MRRVISLAALAILSVALAVYQPNGLTAIATAALTGFAAIQIGAERARRRSEERTADARLSVNAFALRKTIADWITISQEVGWGDGPANRAQEAVDFARGLSDRLEQGLVTAAGASPAVAAKMRTAYAHWQRAVMQFESYLAQYVRALRDARRGADAAAQAAFSMMDSSLLTDGRESLRACYLTLEAVVDPALLAEATRLGALPPI
ncbi:MAG: hypothetical protein ACREMN_11535 [Gemmatimonadales bacterium]